MAKKEKIIRVGLKSNAVFLWEQMRGDTLGGVTGLPFYNSIVFLTQEQFKKFKKAIRVFGGNIQKSLTKENDKYHKENNISYSCYFVKR